MENQTDSEIDLTISTVQEALLVHEQALSPIPVEAEGRTHAAVSMVLREGEELAVLMIKRAVREDDPWSGQMALPGGRRDPSDESLLQTAIRETEEEVGLSLGTEAKQLGRLEAMVPATDRLPPITIFPFVFGVPEGTKAQVCSQEVDETLWIPLSTLRDPSVVSTVEIHYRDRESRTFPCLRMGDRVIWGLTYRILTGFLGLL